jgi:predicted O-linked N-acetylglucosamine transferase (SPINDLY family)
MHVQNLFSRNFCDRACSFPRGQLVACAFHRPVKIDPESLSLWASIILSHPSAILWIISYEESALENLMRELDDRSLSGRCCNLEYDDDDEFT